MLKFTVEGQKLELIGDPFVVADSFDYLTGEFRFYSGYDWDLTEKHVFFQLGEGTLYEVVLVDNKFVKTDHVNLTTGTWSIYVIGYDINGATLVERITTNKVSLTVDASGVQDGEPFPPSIIPDILVTVDQSTPQTFIGGIPKLAADRVIDQDNEIADKKFVVDTVATVTADDFNHNDLANKQGGSAGEYYHMTQAQNAALHAHSNKSALDAVSGTNTGDQDVSGAISTHNTDAGAHAALIDAIDDINEYGYNLKNGLLAYRLALADVGRNPIKIAAIGTSITFGKWASDVTLTSWSGRIRTAMQNKYGNVGRGNYVPGVDAGEQSVHTWWTFSGAWSFNSNYGIGGKGFYGQGSDKVATLVFTGSSIDLIYQKASNGSVSGVSITIDGVSQTPPDFSGSAALGQVKSYTGLADGSHTMVITADSAAGKYCYIEGAIAYNPILSGDRGCYLFEYGCPSGTASYFTAGSSRLVPATGAKLVIIELGTNDTADTASFYTNMQTIISNIKANARTSVLLLTPYHFYGVNTANLDIINGMLYTLADTYNCALIDMDKRFGESYAAMDALGVWGSYSYNGNEGHDGVHPSDKGHRFMADTILSILDAVSDTNAGAISTHNTDAGAHAGQFAPINAQLATDAITHMLATEFSGAYEGVDLSVRFATEIAGYSDVWAWIKARVQAENFAGLHAHDYITVTCGNPGAYVLKEEILGINTYKGSGGTEIPAHIDWGSKDCWPDLVQYNRVDFNNGIGCDKFTAIEGQTSFQLKYRGKAYPAAITSMTINGVANTSFTYVSATGIMTYTGSALSASAVVKAFWAAVSVPFMASNLNAYMNSLKMGVPNEAALDPFLTEVDFSAGGIYYYLPAALKAVITPKRMYAATRYTAGSLLTSSNNYSDVSIESLWIPEEMEVCGSSLFATGTYDKWYARQYPVFVGGSRKMGAGNGGSRIQWWIFSALSGSSAHFGNISNIGYVYGYTASGVLRVPVCFRIAKT